MKSVYLQIYLNILQRMLSILIPVYNSSCVQLVRELHEQAKTLKIEFEIVVIDDSSTKEWIKEQNRTLKVLSNFRLIERSDNVGPAIIRNELARQAAYPYLLYLDSDTLPINNDFLQVYLNRSLEDIVLCGGFCYKKNLDENNLLRYKYGIKVEQQPASKRNKHPYMKFISMNFFLPKDVMLKVGFDESYRFGYEDAIFGKRLAESGIQVLHIENPVWHNSMDNSMEYLRKIRLCVTNLKERNEDIVEYIRLLKWHKYVHILHLKWLVKWIFKKSKKAIERNLTGRYPSMKLFAFYKLGCLCE